MPITITIQGADAQEVRQLVQDLAGTIAGMKNEDIPVDTNVSTIEEAQPTPPVAQASNHGQLLQPAASVMPPSVPQQAPVATVPTAPQQPAQQQQTTAPVAPTAAPTAAPTYDFNQLATATMSLQQAGVNIFELFQQFGIAALNQLPKERYAEYAAVLRQRGAKI